MFGWLIGPLRATVGVLAAHDSSRQIAAGVAIGVVLGLVPKATLLAVLIGVVLCSLRVNKAAGLTVASLVGLVAPLLDGFMHKLGLKVLILDSLQPTYAWLYDQPLGPWWGLHNSVVCGALLLGLYLTYPVYLITRGVVDRLRPWAVRQILKYKLGRVLFGAEVTSKLGSGLGFGA